MTIGASFKSGAIEKFTRLTRVEYRQSAAYNPRANGKAERSVKMVKEVLKRITKDMKDWSSMIHFAVDIVNATKLMYGYSPREIAIGIKTKQLKFDFSKELTKYTFPEEKQMQFMELEQIHFQLYQIEKVKEARRITNDVRNEIREKIRMRRKDTDLNIPYTKGEWVYRLRTKHNKFEPTWDSPYMISEIIGPNTFKLIDVNGKERKFYYHASKLKPAYHYRGTPIRTAAEYTRVYSDKSDDYYLKTLEDIEKHLSKDDQ